MNVNTHETYDGLTNPLYLFGNFGVYNDSGIRYLRKMQDRGEVGNFPGCGLSFYAGDVIYSRDIDLGSINTEEPVEVYIDNILFQDSVGLYVNGFFAGIKLWSPYSWTIDGKWLKSGLNTLELCVTTTLAGLFEGQLFDQVSHRYVNV